LRNRYGGTQAEADPSEMTGWITMTYNSENDSYFEKVLITIIKVTNLFTSGAASEGTPGSLGEIDGVDSVRLVVVAGKYNLEIKNVVIINIMTATLSRQL
jgi:hypothetical protein